MKSLPQSCEECFKEFTIALDNLRNLTKRNKSDEFKDSHARELLTGFEVAHELGLKVITKYFQKQGKGPFSGSRDLTVEAFHADLIDDGKAWLDIVIDRIQYNPVYSIDSQSKFLENIATKYLRLLNRFEDTMGKKLEA
jgi:nucleotidyltransferase substrate binding protein (TIGR01987 family)